MAEAPGTVEVAATPEALMDAAAACFSAAAAGAIRARGRFTVALSGGSTPKRLYALLATPSWASRVEWPRVHVFWGDERCVQPTDPASNYRMAREALLDAVPVAAANVHRVRGEDEPAAAAAAYERELRAAFATPAGPPRCDPGACFDLVLLGMGDNGHTASLFPGSAVLHEEERWAVADEVDATPRRRVTLTAPVLNAAAEVAFLVSGRDKAPMLHRVLEGPRDPDALPAQLVRPRAGRLRWLVDADAAAELEKR